MAYGKLNRAAAMRILGVGDRTLTRLLNGTGRPATLEAIEQLAAAAGVPAWFAKRGFGPPPDEDALRSQVIALERRLERLERQVGV